jgi:hypothetical protein
VDRSRFSHILLGIIIIIVVVVLQPFVEPWSFLCTVIKTATYTQDNTDTSMPRVDFELTTPVFEQAKTAYALDLAATLISILLGVVTDNTKHVDTKTCTSVKTEHPWYLFTFAFTVLLCMRGRT